LDVAHRCEEVRVEDFGPVGAIEAFDEGVLIGLARLDVADGDALLCGVPRVVGQLMPP
jgi:hypothetical protein